MTVEFEQQNLFASQRSWQDACLGTVMEIVPETPMDPYLGILSTGHVLEVSWQCGDIHLHGNTIWKNLATYALLSIEKMTGIAQADAALSIHKLLVMKQKDYGKQNIKIFGLEGILIRVCDKIERLKNLTAKAGANSIFDISSPNHSVKNESMIDTVYDIAGYAIIAVMLSTKDKFGSPLFDYEMVDD